MTGKNIEPFCAKPKHNYCDPTFRDAGSIKNNCAPVYFSTQSPQTSCSVFDRCRKYIMRVRKIRENNDLKNIF